MSYLNYNLEEVEELTTVSEGEYEIECSNAEVKTSSNTGGQYVILNIDVVGEENAKDINHVMMLPAPGDDPKKEQRRLSNLKKAANAFGVNYTADGFNVEDFIGLRANAFLVEEDEGGQYGVQNRIRSFIEAR